MTRPRALATATALLALALPVVAGAACGKYGPPRRPVATEAAVAPVTVPTPAEAAEDEGADGEDQPVR